MNFINQPHNAKKVLALMGAGVVSVALIIGHIFSEVAYGKSIFFFAQKTWAMWSALGFGSFLLVSTTLLFVDKESLFKIQEGSGAPVKKSKTFLTTLAIFSAMLFALCLSKTTMSEWWIFISPDHSGFRGLVYTFNILLLWAVLVILAVVTFIAFSPSIPRSNHTVIV